MLVVLEGCDGSGKSTLATNLAQILDAEIIHCTSKTPNDKKFFEGIIKASKKRNIIADRFCYGQFIYQKEKDRPLKSVKNLNNLEAKMLEAGAKIVYVEAPAKEIEERLSSRGERVINELSVSDVLSRYQDMFVRDSILGDSVIRWDTGGR